MLTILCLVTGQGSQSAVPSAPQPRVLLSPHQERLFLRWLFLATTAGKAAKAVLSILAFFYEPSVTSKPISGFYFGLTT